MRNGSSDVLNEFRQGDLDAFETLFRLHQRAVYGWILRIVRNPAAAEDLTVETFWRIYRPTPVSSLARIRGLGAPHRHPRGARLAANPAARDRVARRTAGPSHRRSRPSRTRFGAKPRWRFSGCRPSCALRPFWPSSRSSRTKKWPRRLAFLVAAVKLRVFRALRLLRKDLQQQGITP
jgi:hypothetical protein